MKKFIFFDIVSFTLCLESLILQQGADSSLVEGKSIKFLCKHNQIIDIYLHDLIAIITIIMIFFLFTEEFRETITSNSYSDHHWIHFTNRHKRELGHASFHSNGNQNGKETFIRLRMTEKGLKYSKYICYDVIR